MRVLLASCVYVHLFLLHISVCIHKIGKWYIFIDFDCLFHIIPWKFKPILGPKHDGFSTCCVQKRLENNNKHFVRWRFPYQTYSLCEWCGELNFLIVEVTSATLSPENIPFSVPIFVASNLIDCDLLWTIRDTNCLANWIVITDLNYWSAYENTQPIEYTLDDCEIFVLVRKLLNVSR